MKISSRMKRRIGVAVLFAGALAISACSDDDSGNATRMVDESAGGSDNPADSSPDVSVGSLADILGAARESDAVPFDGEALQRELDRRFGVRDAQPMSVESDDALGA